MPETKISEITSSIIQTISDKSGVAVVDINVDHTLEHLKLDSLDHMEVCMIIEDTFDIEIPDKVMNKWKTVKSVIDTSMPFILGKTKNV